MIISIHPSFLNGNNSISKELNWEINSAIFDVHTEHVEQKQVNENPSLSAPNTNDCVHDFRPHDFIKYYWMNIETLTLNAHQNDLVFLQITCVK